MQKRRIYGGILLAALLGIIGWVKLSGYVYHPHSMVLYWDYIQRNVQWIPFRTISELAGLCFDAEADATVRLFAELTLGANLLMWFPGGVLLPMTFPTLKNPRRFAGCVLACIVLLELLQVLLLRGTFDIDDILLNAVGALAGFWVFRKFDHSAAGSASDVKNEIV